MFLAAAAHRTRLTGRGQSRAAALEGTGLQQTKRSAVRKTGRQPTVRSAAPTLDGPRGVPTKPKAAARDQTRNTSSSCASTSGQRKGCSCASRTAANAEPRVTRPRQRDGDMTRKTLVDIDFVAAIDPRISDLPNFRTTKMATRPNPCFAL